METRIKMKTMPNVQCLCISEPSWYQDSTYRNHRTCLFNSATYYCTHLFCSELLLEPSTPPPTPVKTSKTSRVTTSQNVDLRSPQRRPRGFFAGLCKGRSEFISERTCGYSWWRVWPLWLYAVGNSSCLVGNSSCLVGSSSCRESRSSPEASKIELWAMNDVEGSVDPLNIFFRVTSIFILQWIPLPTTLSKSLYN